MRQKNRNLADKMEYAFLKYTLFHQTMSFNLNHFTEKCRSATYRLSTWQNQYLLKLLTLSWYVPMFLVFGSWNIFIRTPNAKKQQCNRDTAKEKLFWYAFKTIHLSSIFLKKKVTFFFSFELLGKFSYMTISLYYLYLSCLGQNNVPRPSIWVYKSLKYLVWNWRVTLPKQIFSLPRWTRVLYNPYFSLELIRK